MSISKSMRIALTAAAALGRTTIRINKETSPVLRGFNEKWHLVQCRGCKGTGTKDGSVDNCPQCGGKGVEKLSRKAILKAAEKMQVQKVKEEKHGE